MAIQYVGGNIGGASGSTTTGVTVSLTSLTGGISSTAVENDIVLAFVGIGSTSDINVSMATSGYTELADLYGNAGKDANLGVFYKIMGSTPDTTAESFRSGDSAHAQALAVHVFRGVDLTTPIDVTTTTVTGTAARPTPPAITPITTGAVVVCVGDASFLDTNTTGYEFSDSQLSNFITIPVNDTNDISIGTGWASWTSGVFTPIIFTSVGSKLYDAFAAATIALRPSATVLNTSNYFQYF